MMAPFTPDLKERCFTEWKLPLRGALVAKKKEEELKKSRQEKAYNPLETSADPNIVSSSTSSSTQPQKFYSPVAKGERLSMEKPQGGDVARSKLEARPVLKRMPRPKEPEQKPTQPQGQFVLDSKTKAALAKYKKH
jgi:hypothetical protein